MILTSRDLSPSQNEREPGRRGKHFLQNHQLLGGEGPQPVSAGFATPPQCPPDSLAPSGCGTGVPTGPSPHQTQAAQGVRPLPQQRVRDGLGPTRSHRRQGRAQDLCQNGGRETCFLLWRDARTVTAGSGAPAARPGTSSPGRSAAS